MPSSSESPELNSEMVGWRTFISGFLNWLQKNKVAEELNSLRKIACPVAITGLLFQFKSIISMLFLGHLGDIELAGGSLSLGIANITGYSVLKGLAMGMEPICSQAYGAKKGTILSQACRRTLSILIVIIFPISILWVNIEHILLSLGQEQAIISVAKVYIIYSIPELIAQALLNPLRIFLRTQNINKPLTIAASFALIFHIAINIILAMVLNLGVRGVALAAASHTFIVILGLLVYLIFSRTALKPWDWQAVDSCNQGWWSLLSLMLPSLLSICLEWWWYEIMLIMCGLLSDPQASVSAMGILIQTTGLLYVFPNSLNQGLSTLVGQALGAEQPGCAQRTTTMGIIVAFVGGLLASAFAFAVRDAWGKLYTSESAVLALTKAALPILGLCELGNCPQTAACGILLGSARPKLGVCINFCAFYIIGLPVAALMAFELKIGFLGLWYGLAAAQASCVVMMIITLFCTDWKLQAQRAKELTQSSEEEASLLS